MWWPRFVVYDVTGWCEEILSFPIGGGWRFGILKVDGRYIIAKHKRLDE